MRNTILDILTWIKIFRIYSKTTSSIEARENLTETADKLQKVADRLLTGKDESGKPVKVPDTAQAMLHLWRKIHKQEWRYATLNVLDDGGNQASLILSLIRDTAENLLRGDYVVPDEPINQEEVTASMNPVGICRHCNRVIEAKAGFCPSCREEISEKDVLEPAERKEKTIEIIMGDDFENLAPSTIFLLNGQTGSYECSKCGFAPFESGITKDAMSRNVKKCPSCGYEGVQKAQSLQKSKSGGGLFRKHKPTQVKSRETVEMKLSPDDGEYKGFMEESPWPADGGNCYRSGFSNGIGAKNGKVKWSLPLTPDLSSPPVLDGEGNIYLGTMGGGFVQIKPDSTFGWNFIVEEDISSSACIDVNGFIYLSVPGKTYKLNPDGTPRGMVREGSDFPPVLDRNGNLYIISEGNLISAGSEGGIRWKTSLGAGVEEIIHDLTPTMGPEGNIYVSTDHLVGFNSNGKELFRTRLLRRGTRPSVSSDGIIYLGTENQLMAVRNNGTILWQKEFRDYVNTPIAIYNGEYLLFGTMNIGILYCVTMTGGVVWEFKADGALSTPVSIDYGGNIYFSSQNGKIYSVTPKGKLRWEYSTKSLGFFGGGVFNSAPAVGKAGVTYASCQDGKLYAFA